jgi:hypothetical protein
VKERNIFMIFTNKYSLPQSVFNALTIDSYDLSNKPGNIFSVTDIINSPKIKILEERHNDEINVDISERMWMLLGTACHYIIEQASSKDDLAEERWYLDINTLFVYTAAIGVPAIECSWYKKDSVYLSGKFDLYIPDDKKVSDYKITTVWSWVIEKKMKPEHEAQLNLNGFALRQLQFPVEKVSIMAFFRDWSKSKSKGSYPDLEVPMKEIQGEVWNDFKCIKYIKDRINLHLECRELPDDEIPICSEKERWTKSSKYAIMKEGRKTAVKLYDEPITSEILESYGPKHYIEERPGEDTRCIDYCSACEFCNYYKQVYSPSISISGAM